MPSTDISRALRARLTPAALVATCSAAALTLAALPTGVAAAAPAVPVVPEFSSEVDPYPYYAGQKEDTCDQTEKPGVVAFRDLLDETYGPVWSNILRNCPTTPRSGHHSGRALDWTANYDKPEEFERATTLIEWLLAPDADGNEHAMARRLGLFYIIYNNKWFTLYSPDSGWRDYNNCTVDPTKAEPELDTYCHRDHIHFSFTWEGARAETSFFHDNSPEPEPEPTPEIEGRKECGEGVAVPAANKAPAVLSNLGYVPLEPVRLFDTRTDEDLQCQIAAGSSYTAAITDAAVPANEAGAVVLNVTAVDASGDAYVSVTPGGLVQDPRDVTGAVHVNADQTMSSLVVVPLGAQDTVTFGVGVSDIDLVVDVMGYFPKDGSGDPFEPTSLTRALDATIPKGTWQSVGLDIPSDASAVAANLVGDQPQDLSYMTLHPQGSGVPQSSNVNPAADRATANRALVATNGASLDLYSNKQQRAVLDVSGWFGPQASTTFTPLNPERVVDTRQQLGATENLSVEPLTIDVAAVSNVPSGAAVAVATVTMVGQSHDTWLSTWESGKPWPGTSDLNAVVGVPQCNLVLIPLNEKGEFDIAVGHGRSDVVIDVLGYFGAIS